MNRYDIISAYYLYFSEYYDGQASREYARLCKLQTYFKPSPLFNGLEDLDYDAVTVYEGLVIKHYDKLLRNHSHIGNRMRYALLDINLASIYQSIVNVWSSLDFEEDEDGEFNVINVRLNFYNSSLSIKWGDPQYDTDHRGHWAYNTLAVDDNVDSLAWKCYRMIEEILDSIEEAKQERIGAGNNENSLS